LAGAPTLTLRHHAPVEMGDRIRRARMGAGLSQRDLANAVGVTHGMVAQWETHRKPPGRETLRRIAEVTFVDLTELLGNVTHDNSGALLVTEARQRQLLRLFVRLPVKAQDNLLELLAVTADVARLDKRNSHATHPARPID